MYGVGVVCYSYCLLCSYCSCYNLIGLMVVLLLVIFVELIVVDVVPFVIGLANGGTSVILIGVTC